MSLFAHHNVQVVLEDLAEKLEEVSDHWDQYLNVTSGAFESLSDGMHLEPEEERVKGIENTGNYRRLPNQYDIHEYRIMEDFAEELPDVQKQGALFGALRDRTPYRHFKDEINRLGVDKVYYAFRYLALIETASEWCEDSGIPYHMRNTGNGDGI